MTNRPLRVFLCHSSNDKPAVRELYQKLRAEPWIQPWLDEEELYPGQDWNMEIEKAIEATDVILVCLSNNSITKEGYVQREIRIALDYADYKPDGTLFIIPVRLEECVPPKRLARWQYADYFESQRERGVQRLVVSLNKRAKAMNLKIDEIAPQPDNFYEKAVKYKEVVEWIDNFENTSNNKPISNELNSNKLILSNGMEFMRVPAGKFWMGSNDFGESEKPLHSVEVSYDYWVARYLITNENYRKFRKFSFVEERHTHPFIAMYYEAQDYIKWLNGELQKSLPQGYLFSLPSESEWEKAARGTDKLIYPWGDSFDKQKCNSKESGIGNTTPVGFYSPNGDSPFGCADMVGNVWEWTRSPMQNYPYDSVGDKEDSHYAQARVVRGGSYKNISETARCAKRFKRQPKYKYANVGFRLALIPST